MGAMGKLSLTPMMLMTNRVIFFANRVINFVFSDVEVRSLFWALDQSEFKIDDGELSIAFLNSDEMCAVHAKFLNDPALTDVVTFNGDATLGFAGEICVSPDYAMRSCIEHGLTFSEELCLYLIHGYLHLSGLDDISENEIIKMRNGENFCMSFVKKNNAMPNFSYVNL
jgi:probable rRNA maturation factor